MRKITLDNHLVLIKLLKTYFTQDRDIYHFISIVSICCLGLSNGCIQACIPVFHHYAFQLAWGTSMRPIPGRLQPSFTKSALYQWWKSQWMDRQLQGQFQAPQAHWELIIGRSSTHRVWSTCFHYRGTWYHLQQLDLPNHHSTHNWGVVHLLREILWFTLPPFPKSWASILYQR